MRTATVVLLVPLVFATASPTLAQCDSGGAAVFTINGLRPGVVDPVGHVVDVSTAEGLHLRITDGGANGLIFLTGAFLNCGGFLTPWGGSIDVAGVQIVGDGITPLSFFDHFFVTDFDVTLGVGCGTTGITPPMQAIVQDPTFPPFFLDNTEPGAASFFGDFCATYGDEIADDGFAVHTLGPGMSIVYGGVSYTQMYIAANGVVTFDFGSTDNVPTLQEFFSNFQADVAGTDNPGVAPFWGDFHRSIAQNDLIVVTETLATNDVRVRWQNQEWWWSNDPAGSWSVHFGVNGANTLDFDLTGALPGLAGADVDPIVGVSDGDFGNNTTVDFTALLGGGVYVAPPGSGPQAIGELFPMAGNDLTQPFDLGLLSFTDPLGNLEWTIQAL